MLAVESLPATLDNVALHRFAEWGSTNTVHWVVLSSGKYFVKIPVDARTNISQIDGELFAQAVARSCNASHLICPAQEVQCAGARCLISPWIEGCSLAEYGVPTRERLCGELPVDAFTAISLLEYILYDKDRKDQNIMVDVHGRLWLVDLCFAGTNVGERFDRTHYLSAIREYRARYYGVNYQRLAFDSEVVYTFASHVQSITAAATTRGVADKYLFSLYKRNKYIRLLSRIHSPVVGDLVRLSGGDGAE